MGYNNAACLLSGVTIRENDEVVGFIIGNNGKNTYLPYTLPFEGVYNNYSGVCDIKENFSTIAAKKWLGEDIFKTTLYGEKNMHLVLILKTIYNQMTEPDDKLGVNKLLSYDDYDFENQLYGYNIKRLLPPANKIKECDICMLSRFYMLHNLMYKLQKSFYPMYINMGQQENYLELKELNIITTKYIENQLQRIKDEEEEYL